ncbi:transcriptional repressor LexA [Deinococcus radiodurans]|jgi:SOS regulatory protein LexA|uniref:LexA repressor n=1 Tax=Deinococcus radiodurans (strain ATCC 13939 / DSM 20539 / JCM 16871 / CCUG 27074 / LMG 4051 / NBRC 15346 / NCIMB 9279 / VKM B-1422 / R1) TaxID=243230 RepID=LEXA_DEIRA|nr:transcriptional repressor LexA [Deinococcus radiodurans]O32506.1 RecName: Full=LexA repressor [Deinococcus radiodurans R1 = ATCC 13939 = DSM 20539]ANC72855.1 LexA family transcriptional regulator [Deinococcus radiodurans R1 = ATCC 13939 = DSM 20539]QIP30507.1 repressor LexA [Deinococcus radiodurans]QIP33436.1 repressor LexA [Deinococcus radiodurans]UID71918.1 LexA family transcriptional regulator [Deinococcus radiodurans R1 = ATCC 13939 = DSM 20539]UTA52313.1 transcriptional repressor LexA
MPPELTPTRRSILQATLRLGAGATAGQVAQEVGITKQAISQQVNILRKLGYLQPAETRYGPLQVTDRARAALGEGLPIYGQIAAGIPALAEQSPEDFTPSIEALLGLKAGDFLLRVRGESMTGIGVMDGDYVVVRPAPEVHDGEVAVVLVPGDNAATLKRLYHFGQDILLTSENPAMPRLSFPAEQVQVQGRMVGRVGVGAPRVSHRVTE